MGKVTDTGKARRRSKRAKQTKIAAEGFGRKTPVHPEVEKAAEAFVEARDERMELTKREVETQQRLVAAMENAGLSKYVCDESKLEVTLSELKKAKVRNLREPDAAEA